MFRACQKSRHQLPGALAFPIRAREARRINKCPIQFTAIEQTFLKKAIERGHHGGIGERPAQLLRDVSHVAFAAGPENVHDTGFQVTQGSGRWRALEKTHYD